MKLHCFPNGNKRFGFVLALAFLVRNNKHLDAPPGTMTKLAKYVAESKPHEPEGHPEKIIEELKAHFAPRIRDGMFPPGGV